MKIGKTNLENCKHCGEQIASKFDPNLTFFCQEKQFFAENYLVLKKILYFLRYTIVIQGLCGASPLF